MSFHLGRLLQLLGMALLPLALYVGLVRDNVRAEVMLLFVGGALFVLGWILTRER